MTDAITQFEGQPESWPEVSGVTGDLLAVCWQRVEHHIGRRYAARQVVWTLTTCGGEWVPPLSPVTLIEDAFRWQDGDWQAVNLKRGPFGWILPAGNVQIDAIVGGGLVPAAVDEAVKRLADYLSAESLAPSGARSYSINIDQAVSESVSMMPNHMARALQNSGAADLLRPYRRA
jgi:hypothetical protein